MPWLLGPRETLTLFHLELMTMKNASLLYGLGILAIVVVLARGGRQCVR